MKTEHFRKMLEAEKQRLESEMETIGRRNPRVPNDWEPAPIEGNMESDIIDQADVIVNQENNAAILIDLESRYDSILAALDRIDKGTFGKCGICGGKISGERLDADPAATTCVEHL